MSVLEMGIPGRRAVEGLRPSAVEGRELAEKELLAAQRKFVRAFLDEKYDVEGVTGAEYITAYAANRRGGIVMADMEQAARTLAMAYLQRTKPGNSDGQKPVWAEDQLSAFRVLRFGLLGAQAVDVLTVAFTASEHEPSLLPKRKIADHVVIFRDSDIPASALPPM